MNRKNFLRNSAVLGAAGLSGQWGLSQSLPHARPPLLSKFSHRLPKTDGHYKVTAAYVEETPVPEYTWASDEAYEAFLDMKFGIRLHWGPYSLLQLSHESWKYLDMTYPERQAYQELYKTWYPAGFDAEEWVDFFAAAGARMFSFTTKHHDGFSMFNTAARVKNRVNWMGPGGPQMESCNFSYSIMDTPFKRDVTRELCNAAHRKGLKVDLYYSHPDWYDADFRPYNHHPLQTTNAAQYAVKGNPLEPELKNPQERFKNAGLVIVDDPGPEEIARMMRRHRQQLEELITQYGPVAMVCLDQWLSPSLWPHLRETMLYLRKLRPDVMYRARGIGNYGDYYTPEGFVPGNKENTDTPWFVIYPLGTTFSYEADSRKHKGSQWIVKNLVDSVAKGGNFMAGIGPDGNGRFHTEAKNQLLETGKWLQTHGKGIYHTRAREGENWREGTSVRFTINKEKTTIYCFVESFTGDRLALRTVQPAKHTRTRVTLLSHPDTPLKWHSRPGEGIEIELPGRLLDSLTGLDRYMITLKLEGISEKK